MCAEFISLTLSPFFFSYSIRFVQMISDYCKCLSEMPALAQDMLRKLFELLRLFNNQVCVCIGI